MEGGCESTNLDSFAFTCGIPENWVTTKIFEHDTKNSLYPLTTDQKENQFFLLSEYNDTGKWMNIKLKIFPESYQLCGNSEKLYKTFFKSPFVNYQVGFAIPGGELRTKQSSCNANQFSIDNTSQLSYTFLSCSELNAKWVGAQPWQSVGAEEIDYEVQLGTKLDDVIYFNSKQLRHSEVSLLQNQCELERTQ